MNSIYVLALCLTAVLAAPQFNDPNHYAQHAQSVQLARQGQSARIENLGGSNTQQIVPSDDICGLCESSHSGSDFSQATANGVGFVVPVAGGESSSSSSQFSSSSSDQSAPVYVPISGGESSSFQSSSSSQSENFGSNAATVQKVVYSPSSGNSESFSQHSQQISETSVPVVQPVIYSPSSGSESYSQHSEKHVQSAAPVVQVYAPSGGSSHYHHSQKVVASNAVPIAPIFTPSVNEHFAESRFSESGSTIPVAPIVTYSPSSGSTFSSHQRRQHLQQQLPVVVPVIPASENSHYESHVSKASSQASPTIIVPAYGGGGHSVHSESHFGQIKSTPITPLIYPVLPSSSHSSYQKESSHSSNHASPQIVYQTAPSTSSKFVSQHSSSSGNFGGNLGVVSYPSLASSSSQFSEDSSSLSSGNFGSSAGVLGFPSSSQINSRFGSEFGSSSHLGQYMSESERLARLQAQNIQSSSGYKSSSVGDYNGAHVVPVATGSRAKSWEKSSKWASESEYDHTGKTKNSGYLSTAEGEDETVNGRSSGYRAATTTVDNDGKRSTYSIHTP